MNIHQLKGKSFNYPLDILNYINIHTYAIQVNIIKNQARIIATLERKEYEDVLSQINDEVADELSNLIKTFDERL